MRSILTSACLFGCLLATTATAVAAPASVTIKYTNTELTTEAGAAAVYDRIAVATKRVCTEEQRTPLFMALVVEAQCQKETLSNTVAKVNAPALNAYYDALLKQPRNAATRSETLASR